MTVSATGPIRFQEVPNRIRKQSVSKRGAITELRKREAIRGLVPFPALWKKETEHPESNCRIEYYHYFNEPYQLRGLWATLWAL